MRLARATRSVSRLGLTPLIDMIFLLLLFFLIESEFIAFSQTQLAPPLGSGGAEATSLPIIIRLSPDGQTDWNDTPMPLSALLAQTRAATSHNDAQVFVLMPAVSVTIQSVITLMDRLSKAGARTISLERDVLDIDLNNF